MKIFFKLSIGFIFVFIITGCIGENYDFSPPAINLSSNSNIKSEELAEANIDWRGEDNNLIEKVTNDILVLAKKQQPIYFKTGEKVDILSEHADFKTEGVNVSVWQNDNTLNLQADDISFYLPKEKGEYVIEVNLQTDRGNAQYVGNLVLIE